jgi:hypothetical protein
MVSKLRAYPLRIKIVLAILTLQLFIPLLWLILGAFLPTIPFIASGMICWFVFTGIFSIGGIVGIIKDKLWGKLLASGSMVWIILAALVVLALEAIRVLVTDYPDPIWFTASEFMILFLLLSISGFGLAVLAIEIIRSS